MSRRTERVSELLRGEVAEALRREVSDPRVRLVTITKVDVAPDFSQALVFWSTLDEKADVEEIQSGLDAAASYLRGRLAQKSQLKRMPRLVFRHDATLAEGDATLALLREIADGAKS
ncbi:MAG: 30S ribosome-binding factor RbfA [Deltaproteobacteria bacterium]|nr:30S ribosome-binding factor RbfA [Deltaproteobacteria bacterium]MBW2361655.1 30S ribosome-binding factor RbfA [Deltaproteobacteria bacterium]